MLTAILSDAAQELRERVRDYPGEEPSDVIFEIADGFVPVYTSDLLDLAAEDNSLATLEPELGPAFDGSATPVNIIAANVFERVQERLWETWRELEEEDCV